MRMMKQNKRKQQMLMALAAVGATGVGQLTAIAATTADAATMRAGDFDLTKQADSAPFPVVFDRPSGINAAALAGAVRTLGPSSDLYKSAVTAIPELTDATKINGLLNDSLSEDKTVATQARSTILKLINWYNSLGGFQIKTQDGKDYTISNLDAPINTIAVGFANKEANKAVSDAIQRDFGSVRTTSDVMRALDRHQPGASAGFQKAFDEYAEKVNAPKANIEALSDISAVQPLLASYEKMYSDGAGAIRGELLKVNGATDAAVAFFESAVITGRIDNKSDGASGSNEKPATKQVKTRWLDSKGNVLSPDETGSDYKGEKDISGYKLREARVDNGVKTYVYDKTSEKTVWVDNTGARLKADADGTMPDKNGDAIPGYTLVKSETRNENGNKVTVNVYTKNASGTNVEKPLTNNDTYWFDGNGNELKTSVKGQTLPDDDGKVDVPGYKLLKAFTVTEDSLKGDLKGSKFKVGDIINIYEKDDTAKPTHEPAERPANKPVDKPAEQPADKPVDKPVDKPYEQPADKPVDKPYEQPADKPALDPNAITTKWVDEKGNALKDPVEGSKPDAEGDDVPGYRALRTIKDAKGNVTNVYERLAHVPMTTWVDEDGKSLKDEMTGEFPDKEGDDVKGYKLLHSKKSDNGDVVNTYHKIVTTWVNEAGKTLQDQKDGEFADVEGDDIKDAKFVRTDVKENGDIENIYRTVVTTWVDEDGKVIKEPAAGASPDKEGDDVPGYKLVQSEVKANGDVVNTYHQVMTKWVDKDGTELKKPEVGDHSDKEGDDIKGYKFVGTKVDDKTGDIVNMYQKETKKVTTHWVDKDGKRLSQDETGDAFGKEKSVDGYRVVDVRTSADGTEKFYVYDKVETPKQLPKTGDASGLAGMIGAALLGLGGVSARRKKEKQ